MKGRFVVVLAMLGIALLSQAQDKRLFEKHWFIRGGDTLPYRVLLPLNYDSTKAYPLMLFLHGRGEAGRDNEKQLVHGANMFLHDSTRTQYPAIVVFPQCGSDDYWANVKITTDSITKKRSFEYQTGGAPTKAMALLVQFVPWLKEKYKLDKHRMYVGGLSMGGMGTFELVRRMPKTFAAAFPICGGAHPGTAKKLRKTDWWIFHGLKDDVVDPGFSKEMAAAIQKKKGDVQLTLYPNANHNAWDPAFREPGILKWVFGQRR